MLFGLRVKTSLVPGKHASALVLGKALPKAGLGPQHKIRADAFHFPFIESIKQGELRKRQDGPAAIQVVKNRFYLEIRKEHR